MIIKYEPPVFKTDDSSLNNVSKDELESNITKLSNIVENSSSNIDQKEDEFCFLLLSFIERLRLLSIKPLNDKEKYELIETIIQKLSELDTYHNNRFKLETYLTQKRILDML